MMPHSKLQSPLENAPGVCIADHLYSYRDGAYSIAASIRQEQTQQQQIEEHYNVM